MRSVDGRRTAVGRATRDERRVADHRRPLDSRFSPLVPIALALLPLGIVTTGSAHAEELERFEFTRIRMGTPFHITVYVCDEAVANTAGDAAFSRIKELNSVFSDYDPRSETSRLTRNAVAGKPIRIGPDLLAVLTQAQELSLKTDGAFDVTVSPVVKLWRRSWRTKQLPPEDELAAARALVGFQNIQIDVDRSTVTFAKSGIQLDFGAIAKGYACDEALKVLKTHGITRALVEAGGDLACGDPPPGRDGWRIALDALANDDKGAERFLLVKNCGVATSGDAYQFVELGGVRYSHIVDPRTGLGLTTGRTVTVIAADGATADALASAVSVLGPKQGRRLIESIEDAEMLMVLIEDAETKRTVTTSGFESFVVGLSQ